MSMRFVFSQHPTLQEAEAIAETPRGMRALAEIQKDFSSVADVLMHTSDNTHGNAVIHVPGDNITLVNISTGKLAATVQPFEAIIDHKFF